MKLFRCSIIAAITLSAMSLWAVPWSFPAAQSVSFNNIPDWSKEGFTLEVWAKPAADDTGYAVLMRGSFGYPNIRKGKNIDCYLITPQSGKKNAAGRVYTDLVPNQYHYYVFTGDKVQSIAYRDGKVMRVNKAPGIPAYNAKNTLHIGRSLGWAKNFKGEIAMVRLHNRALTKAEVRANYALLQANKPLAAEKSLIFNQDRRELSTAASSGNKVNELTLSGVEKAPAPDNAWQFPAKKRVAINNVPDWGKEGFTLEVYALPEIPNGGYAVLMRGIFGYPKFFSTKDFDSYVINTQGKNAGGRVYTALELNKYHYYALTATKDKLVMYRDGKVMRTNKGNSIPGYKPNTPLYIGNSMGWSKHDFKGKIAVVRIAKRALSDKEIKANYQKLQNNLPLPADKALIVNEDRRVTGNFYKFSAGKSVTVKNVAANTLLSVMIKPEKLTDSALITWGKLKISTTADGSVIAAYNNKTLKAEKILDANTTSTITFAMNGTQGALYVDNQATGKVISAQPMQGKADMTIGGGFAGVIGKITVKANDILPEKIGSMVTVTLDNRNVDKVAYPPNRHLVGRTEYIKSIINFDDLTGWKMSYTSGAVKPTITRSKEEPLWSDYVLRTEFCKGEFPAPTAKVVLTPPAPIKITEDFDSIAIWRCATAYGMPRPALRYSIQYRNSKGELCDSGNMGGMLETGWGIHMNPIKPMVKAPAEIVSITFTGFNEDKRVTYFDSLHVYKRPQGKLTDARLMSFKELGIPTRPETILPTASEKGKVVLSKTAKGWKFESVTPSGKKLVFDVLPVTGTLGDIVCTYKNKTFKPMDGGGLYWALDNLYPVKPESLLAPNSKQIKAKLKNFVQKDNKLTLYWLYTIGKDVYSSTWILEVIDNTLIADIRSSSKMVGEFKFGAITGISGKVIVVPYLNIGRWAHRSNPPGIFADTKNNIYISQFVDWYNSDASGLFGDSSSTPGGKYVLNLVTSDHRWVADPNDKSDPHKVVRSASIINGGSFYWPKTDGKRNASRDRIMVTVNENVASVLPNIPNTKRKYLKDTVEAVWATRMWYCRLPYMSYFDEEFAQWQEAKDYGMENLFVRMHGNVSRMYYPRRSGSPSGFIKDFVEPQIGGDAKMAEFFNKMKKLNYRVGIYTDPMVLSPLARDAWDLDMLNLDPNGNWIYSSGNAKQTKVTRQVILQKKFNDIYKKKFAPNCAYIDQITCPPCWRYTDYDARTPEAGKFSAPYRALAESLLVEEADFGPAISEGKTQLFYAGLCDSYAQPQRMYMDVIPDFNLRKLHTMNNDCGFELGWINYKGAKGGTPQKWSYKLLAYEHIYGNIAHIFGNYHGAPLNPLPDYFIRSYFLIQPAQKYYALTPIKDIFYNVNGKPGTLEEAIAADTLSCNQLKIVYENGLAVAANLNDKENFEVTLHGKKYILPPEGFAAYLPGKVETYSALNKAGKRSDLMKEGNLIYIAGNPDIAEISAQYDYTLRKKGETLELTPAPFKKAETVTLQVPFTGKAKVLSLDRKGKTLAQGVIAVKDGKLQLPIDGKAFRYLVSKN